METGYPSGALHPDLDSLLNQFAAIRADAEQLVDGLNNNQFNWRATPEKWSIAQCITHLNIVDGRDLPAIEQAIGQARQSGLTGNGPFRYGSISSWFIRNVEPPPKRLKAKAPDIYVPPPEQDMSVAMAEFRRIQQRLVEVVTGANGLDLVRIKIPTPMATFIKFSLGQRFRLIAAHDRRHLYQAWEVRRALP